MKRKMKTKLSRRLIDQTRLLRSPQIISLKTLTTMGPISQSRMTT
jgi:hypothetical protein